MALQRAEPETSFRSPSRPSTPTVFPYSKTWLKSTAQTKKISMFDNTKYIVKEERKKILKLSCRKLNSMDDPEQELGKAVLINNLVNRLQSEIKEEKMSKYSGWKRKRNVWGCGCGKKSLSVPCSVSRNVFRSVDDKVQFNETSSINLSDLEEELPSTSSCDLEEQSFLTTDEPTNEPSVDVTPQQYLPPYTPTDAQDTNKPNFIDDLLKPQPIIPDQQWSQILTDDLCFLNLIFKNSFNMFPSPTTDPIKRTAEEALSVQQDVKRIKYDENQNETTTDSPSGEESDSDIEIDVVSISDTETEPLIPEEKQVVTETECMNLSVRYLPREEEEKTTQNNQTNSEFVSVSLQIPNMGDSALSQGYSQTQRNVRIPEEISNDGSLWSRDIKESVLDTQLCIAVAT